MFDVFEIMVTAYIIVAVTAMPLIVLHVLLKDRRKR
jgi:hypothetical protein